MHHPGHSSRCSPPSSVVYLPKPPENCPSSKARRRIALRNRRQASRSMNREGITVSSSWPCNRVSQQYPWCRFSRPANRDPMSVLIVICTDERDPCSPGVIGWFQWKILLWLPDSIIDRPLALTLGPGFLKRRTMCFCMRCNTRHARGTRDSFYMRLPAT